MLLFIREVTRLPDSTIYRFSLFRKWKYLTSINTSHFYQHINISFNIEYYLYPRPTLYFVQKQSLNFQFSQDQ